AAADGEGMTAFRDMSLQQPPPLLSGSFGRLRLGSAQVPKEGGGFLYPWCPRTGARGGLQSSRASGSLGEASPPRTLARHSLQRGGGRRPDTPGSPPAARPPAPEPRCRPPPPPCFPPAGPPP